MDETDPKDVVGGCFRRYRSRVLNEGGFVDATLFTEVGGSLEFVLNHNLGCSLYPVAWDNFALFLNGSATPRARISVRYQSPRMSRIHERSNPELSVDVYSTCVIIRVLTLTISNLLCRIVVTLGFHFYSRRPLDSIPTHSVLLPQTCGGVENLFSRGTNE